MKLLILTIFVVVLICAIAVQANPTNQDESIIAQQDNVATEDGANPENSFHHFFFKKHWLLKLFG